jgi:tryptophanyl-tRNA synthetase
MKTALTGIKPTGTPHIGNYLGMIRPTLALAKAHQAFIFIADLHALTAGQKAGDLKRQICEAAATWLALGLAPGEVVFYRQSDVPEICELAWVLSCSTAKGLLNRAHAYKAVVEANLAAGRDGDEAVNAGTYNYPVLMAADILLFGADVVPVGLDQKQHVEIARDIAERFNARYGRTFKLPEALIRQDVAIIAGVDGRKMSKNYNNTIPIFAEPGLLRRQVMSIVTDARRPEDPKDPDKCNLFAIYRHFAGDEALAATRQRYLKGGLAYSTLKEELAELLAAHFEAGRRAYTALINDQSRVELLLAQGAARARVAAVPMLARVRRAVGLA